MLAATLLLLSILAALPFMLAGDIGAMQTASQADLIAQTLNVQYQAALTLCPAAAIAIGAPPCDGSDIDTSTVLDPAIADAPLASKKLVVTRVDQQSSRVLAFVDETVGQQKGALWGQVAAALMKSSGGAAGVGFWNLQSGQVISNQGDGIAVSQTQGTHQLVDGNPIMVETSAP